MHALIRGAGLIAGALTLMGTACPTPEPFLPPRLGPPVRIRAEIAGHRIADTYRACVRIRWAAPDTDSVSVNTYAVLRAAPGESAYALIVRAIPPFVNECFDPAEEFMPETSGSRLLRYRVYAVDEHDRPGDTSAADTVLLQNTPILTYPEPEETLSTGAFAWQVPGPAGGYFTYMFLWDTLGGQWQSPRPAVQSFPAPDAFVPHAVTVPDSVIRSMRGTVLYWGAKIEVGTGVRDMAAGALSIRRCYAR